MKRVQERSGDRDSINSKRVTQAKAAADSAPAGIASRIDGSPHMAAQRKKLQGLFGGAAQLQGQEEGLLQGKFNTVQRAEDEEPLQGKFEAVQRVEEEEALQGKFETAQRVEEEEPLQGKFDTAQRMEDEEPLQGKFEAVQRVEEEDALQGKFETAQRVEEEEPLQGKFDTAQRMEDEEPLQGKFETAQRVEEEDALQGKFETAQRVEEEEPLQGKFDTTQRMEDEEPLQGKFETAQRVEEEEPLQGKFATTSPAQMQQQTAATPNNTGLPNTLKSGIENLSGMSLDGVKVHYNSPQPAQLNAHAYAQGTNIHVAPGQEQHLPHEAWHIVQQAQGRVKPTMQMKEGVPVNDDKGLENEADVMGAKAMQRGGEIQFVKRGPIGLTHGSNSSAPLPNTPLQREIDATSKVDTADINAIDAAADEKRREAAKKEYLAEKGLAAGLKDEGGADEAPAEMLSDLYGGVVDTTGGLDPAATYVDGTKDAKGNDVEKYASTGEAKRDATAGEKQAAAFGVGLGLSAPVLSFYLAVRKLQGGELDKQIEGGFEIASSVSSAVKAGSDVGKTLDENDAAASTASAVAGSVTDGLNALKAGVLSIKGIYDAYKDATSESGSSSREKITAGLNITKGLVTAAGSTVASLKAILALFHQGSAGMANAIPGLGIALSSVQIAIDVYEIIKAKTNEAFINAELAKNQWEGTLGKGKEKRKTQDTNVQIFREEIGKFEVKIAALKTSRAKLVKSGKTAQVAQVDEKIRSLEISREQATGQLNSLEQNVALTSLGQVNVDRQRNSGFSIGVELTKVIASVLSLVPEPGSQAASVTLKAAAAGASLLKKAGDKIKQAARDHAASNPDSVLNSMVDTTRSSDKEGARKKTAVKYVFYQLNAVTMDNAEKVVMVRNLVATTGMSLEGVGRSFEAGGVTQAAKDMMKAMG